MESFEDFGLKIGLYSCLKENMNIYEHKDESHYLTVDPEFLHVDNLEHILKSH